jgi:hypothetical protein
MTTLYLPPSLRYFEPMRVLPGATLDFTSLEYDLIEALRPRLLVDLGAGDAQSFFTFCQSMRDHDIDGFAYAVDEWRDDAAKHAQDPTRYEAINKFAHGELRGSAYLLEMSATAVKMHFDAGAVDFLRLDLRRHREPAEALFDTWLARVAPGGILLLPGTSHGYLDASAHAAEDATIREWHLSTGDGLRVFYRTDPSRAVDDLPELLRLAFFGDEADQASLTAWYAHAARHEKAKAAAAPMRVNLTGKWAARKANP